jgi:hypothetical protein
LQKESVASFHLDNRVDQFFLVKHASTSCPATHIHLPGCPLLGALTQEDREAPRDVQPKVGESRLRDTNVALDLTQS